MSVIGPLGSGAHYEVDDPAVVNAIDIFGSKPVAPLGQLFGQIAGDISGLDNQLDGIATETVSDAPRCPVP